MRLFFGNAFSEEYKKCLREEQKIDKMPFWMELNETSTANRYDAGFGVRAQYCYIILDGYICYFKLNASIK